MMFEIFYLPNFLLETVTVIVLSIFSGILLLTLIILLIIYGLKRQQRKLGEFIEAEINVDARYHEIRKVSQKAKHINDYRKSVIYIAFAFRIICCKILTVRNGRTIAFVELVSTIKGTPKLDTKNVNQLAEIYEKARFTDSTITYEDLKKVEQILDATIQSLNINVDDL